MKTNASFSFLLADLAHSKHGVCCRPRQNIYYLSSVMCEWRTKWTCVTERVCVSALVDECTPSARQAKNSNTHTHKHTFSGYFCLHSPNRHILFAFSGVFFSFFSKNYMCSFIIENFGLAPMRCTSFSFFVASFQRIWHYFHGAFPLFLI